METYGLLLCFTFFCLAESAEKRPVDLFSYAFQIFDDDSLSEQSFNATALLSTLESTPLYSYRTRSGQSTDNHMCGRVSSVPSHLTFITRYRHYQKYTHAYNIPVVSTSRVSNAALHRACYVLRFLLADRPVLRKYLYRYFGRIGIIAQNEGVTTIPEHRHLGSWWDGRARGLGGTLAIPISTGAEENLLCWRNDRYSREDIFLHEFSHGIQEIAIRGGGIPGYFSRLQSAYASAKLYGRWRNTYAMSTVQEYFAEGVQSYFEVNDYSATPNGVHNNINTRSKLRSYDPTLYRLVKEVFPCGNKIHNRCNKGSAPSFRMNCDGSYPITVKPVTSKRGKTSSPRTVTITTPGTGCTNNNRHCKSWQSSGYCNHIQHKTYMYRHCRKSCRCCTNRNQYCVKWAAANYCRSYSSYMKVFCTAACKICG